jgi:hypothetical protein
MRFVETGEVLNTFTWKLQFYKSLHSMYCSSTVPFLTIKHLRALFYLLSTESCSIVDHPDLSKQVAQKQAKPNVFDFDDGRQAKRSTHVFAAKRTKSKSSDLMAKLQALLKRENGLRQLLGKNKGDPILASELALSALVSASSLALEAQSSTAKGQAHISILVEWEAFLHTTTGAQPEVETTHLQLGLHDAMELMDGRVVMQLSGLKQVWGIVLGQDQSHKSTVSDRIGTKMNLKQLQMCLKLLENMSYVDHNRPVTAPDTISVSGKDAFDRGVECGSGGVVEGRHIFSWAPLVASLLQILSCSSDLLQVLPFGARTLRPTGEDAAGSTVDLLETIDPVVLSEVLLGALRVLTNATNENSVMRLSAHALKNSS